MLLVVGFGVEFHSDYAGPKSYIFVFLFNKLYLLFFFLICQLNAPGGGGGGGVTDPVEVEPATPLYALLKSL